MLPADTLAEIISNLAGLNLQPTTAAQILAAVLAPLLRSDPDPPAGPLERVSASSPPAAIPAARTRCSEVCQAEPPGSAGRESSARGDRGHTLVTAA